MQPTPKAIKKFHSTIFSWWDTHRRDLPWRHTSDPYRILVSEVMLQQTQVSRVLPKYHAFLALFPDVSALAQATPAQVLKAWQGMGYNRRALYLKKTAEVVATTYKGIFPKSELELLRLPGVGKYTARAIMVFAFRQNVSMIDTNIRQIIVHFFFDGLPQKEKDVELYADLLVPLDQSWEWHQALMDFGSLEMPNLRPRKTGQKKKNTLPFKETDRYFRGRIVDALREKSWKEQTLIAHMSEFYEKPEAFIERIIEGLLHDGLITRAKNMLELPQR